MALRPASLAALAVRRASDPVQLLAEVAGQLSLIAAVFLLTLTVPPAMVTGRVAVLTAAGVSAGAVLTGPGLLAGPGLAPGVRSTCSKPSRMSSSARSAV